MKAVKLAESTYGTRIFMMVKLASGRTEEIDVYLTNDGEKYSTTADNKPEVREEIISAFNELY